MRKDFTKVVTERPRRGHGKTYKPVRPRGPIGEDECGGMEGMRWPHGRDGKEFSDLIGPLWRFIHSRLGEKWDDVYSEICANLKGRNTQQQHIIGHLWQYVERYVEVTATGAVRSKSCRFWRPRDGDYIYSDFYVDPRDGILKKTKKDWRDFSWRRAKKVDHDRLVVGGITYERFNGNWFEVTTDTMKDTYRNEDGVLVYYSKTVTRKRSLNGRELKELGLRNTPPK